MSSGVQVKLLRVLEERILTPGGEPYPVNIRVIAVSNAMWKAWLERALFDPTCSIA